MSPHIAYCGADCENCEVFRATAINDDKARQELANELAELHQVDIKPEQINCTGCKVPDGQPRYFYCDECEMRLCAIEHGVSSCAACEEYPCEGLKELFKDEPQMKETLDNMR